MSRRPGSGAINEKETRYDLGDITTCCRAPFDPWEKEMERIL
jgi:hypothetical protein